MHFKEKSQCRSQRNCDKKGQTNGRKVGRTIKEWDSFALGQKLNRLRGTIGSQISYLLKETKQVCFIIQRKEKYKVNLSGFILIVEICGFISFARRAAAPLPRSQPKLQQRTVFPGNLPDKIRHSLCLLPTVFFFMIALGDANLQPSVNTLQSRQIFIIAITIYEGKTNKFS